MKNLKFITKILHNPLPKPDPHGSMHMPVYANVAFGFKSSEDIALAFERKKPAHLYSRITNPTIEAFEQRVRAVTDAVGVVALSSGMAAITNVLLAIASAGDNIVTTNRLFGNTYSLFESTLKDWKLEFRFTDLTKPDSIPGLIDEKTRAIFLETITNPQLEIADIKAISKIAKAKNILLITDTTLTPPYVFSSKEFGVDIEVLSSTKFISGGATSVGGLIIDNGTYAWGQNPKFTEDARQLGPLTLINKLRSRVYRNLGSCMSPHTAFFQSVALETLPLRVEASCANALQIAKALEKNPKVKSVHYPGLKSSKFYAIGKKQFGNNPGALLTFDLESKEQCFKFMDRLQVILRATNLNDNRTLILHPASTIFCEYPDDLRKDMDVRETMIRLSVGIEDAQDLIDDINTALG